MKTRAYDIGHTVYFDLLRSRRMNGHLEPLIHNKNIFLEARNKYC